MTLSLALACCLLSHVPQSYSFKLDVERYVGYYRDNILYIGRLDKNGEFTQHVKHKLGPGGELIYSGPHYDDLNSIAPTKPTPVYEFRSGMLIPGKMSIHGYFIPEAGGKIIKFADYKYSPESRRIWNLPGVFEREKAK